MQKAPQPRLLASVVGRLRALGYVVIPPLYHVAAVFCNLSSRLAVDLRQVDVHHVTAATLDLHQAAARVVAKQQAARHRLAHVPPHGDGHGCTSTTASPHRRDLRTPTKSSSVTRPALYALYASSPIISRWTLAGCLANHSAPVSPRSGSGASTPRSRHDTGTGITLHLQETCIGGG